MIEQIILHLAGDYMLQNQWMSNKKTENNPTGYIVAIIHSLIYSLPFWVFLTNWQGWLFIFISHFLIDKYELGKIWIKLANYRNRNYKSVNNGIRIVIDNTFHIICNYVAIVHLHSFL